MIPTTGRMLVFHGRRIFFKDGWEEKLATIGLSPNSDWYSLAPGTAVSLSPMTNCYCAPLPNSGDIYFKRYSFHIHRRKRYFLRPGKAAVEAFGFSTLNDLGIPAPKVLALGEERQWGFLRCNIIVTAGVPNTTNLDTFADRWQTMSNPARETAFRQIALTLAAQLRTAHAAQFFHHDLHWRNLLVQETESGFQPVWIDCPRAQRLRLRARHGSIRDLATLAASARGILNPRQQLRFLARYLAGNNVNNKLRRLASSVNKYLSRQAFSGHR